MFKDKTDLLLNDSIKNVGNLKKTVFPLAVVIWMG